MAGFRNSHRITGECCMGVLPSGIQEAICGSYLSEQYEMKVS